MAFTTFAFFFSLFGEIYLHSFLWSYWPSVCSSICPNPLLACWPQKGDPLSILLPGAAHPTALGSASLKSSCSRQSRKQTFHLQARLLPQHNKCGGPKRAVHFSWLSSSAPHFKRPQRTVRVFIHKKVRPEKLTSFRWQPRCFIILPSQAHVSQVLLLPLAYGKHKALRLASFGKNMGSRVSPWDLGGLCAFFFCGGATLESWTQ